MSDERGDQRPTGPQPHHPPPGDGRPAGYGQAQQYGPQYGQPQQYGQYGQYGGPQQYGPSQPYGPYGGPGQWGVPARPGSVVTSAVLGFVYASFGLLAAVGTLAFGAVVDDLVGVLEDSDPSLGQVETGLVDAARTGLLVFGLIALAWTVAMVWGAVLAVRGRSRVLLLVSGSIAVAATGFLLVVGGLGAADPAAQDAAAGVVFSLLLFLGALAIVVLLCLRSAGQYFAAHRARRAA
ncbi:hypothetical protein [Modestobacter sp. URMC 112]